jgi:hypothetical protein
MKSHKFNDTGIPSIPYDGWKVEYHNKGRKIDLKNLEVHFEPEQEKGYLKGEVLAERMKEKGLNVNVLEYLLKNPEYIPEDWKKYYAIFFWGTIYRSSDGSLCVRCLVWDGGHWGQGDRLLDSGFVAGLPSAVAASTLESDPNTSELRNSDLCTAIKKIVPTLKINIGGKEEELITKSEVIELLK